MDDSPHSDASHQTFDESTGAPSSKTAAVKDKKCQYCGQSFTSSSLGRHLDQYLNKKKPDGVHDVDEIRRLRGGVTRRTVRHSRTHDHDGQTVTNVSPAPPLASTPVIDTLNGIPAGGLTTQLNAANWHSTGVITELSSLSNIPNTPSIAGSSMLSTKRPYSSLSLSGPEPSATEKDTTRALELALREVLDSLRAATARASPPESPFAFDIQSETFPSLVLRLLPTPPTLFSPSPFQTSTSAPLVPPTSTHLELLRLNLSTQIQRWKWESLRTAQSISFPTPNSSNIGEEADRLSRSASQYEELAAKHLDLAFSTWMSHPPEIRGQMWQIELHRAIATSQAKNKELEERIERITQEANRLQGQVEHLSQCQWPREMALWPPERVRFSKEEKDEIKAINLMAGSEERGGSKSDKWDYERLVNKWKKHVREDKSRRTGVAVQNQSHNQNSNAATTAVGHNTPPALNTSDPTTKRVRLYEEGRASPIRRVNGTTSASILESESDSRRKSVRQGDQARLKLVGELADQTKELREFN